MALRISQADGMLEMRGERIFKLGLAVPCDATMVYSDFWRGFALMDKCGEYQLIESPRIINKKDIAEMRNDLVREAIRNDCTHLFMMDSDEVCPPETIPRLFKHQADIVCPIVNKRYPPFEPVAYYEDGRNALEGFEKWNGFRPVLEIATAGTGCMLIDMRVFSLIGEPWFKFARTADGAKLIGEDILFCHRVREAGAKIYLDTSIEVSHLTTFAVTMDFYLLYKLMAESKAKRLKNKEG